MPTRLRNSSSAPTWVTYATRLRVGQTLQRERTEEGTPTEEHRARFTADRVLQQAPGTPQQASDDAREPFMQFQQAEYGSWSPDPVSEKTKYFVLKKVLSNNIQIKY